MTMRLVTAPRVRRPSLDSLAPALPVAEALRQLVPEPARRLDLDLDAHGSIYPEPGSGDAQRALSDIIGHPVAGPLHRGD